MQDLDTLQKRYIFIDTYGSASLRMAVVMKTPTLTSATLSHDAKRNMRTGV